MKTGLAASFVHRIGYAAERGSPAGGASRQTEDPIIGLISLNAADLYRGRSWILDF